MVTNSSFPKALIPGIRKWIMDGITQEPDFLPLVAKINPSQKAREIDQDFAGIADFLDVGNDGGVTYNDPTNGYTTTYTHSRYTNGVKVSGVSIDDDQYADSPIRKQAMLIGQSWVRKRNKVFFDMFNKAFTAAYTSYGDAKPLCSVIHPVPSAAFTQSNASSTSIILSDTNLETGLLAMQQVKDMAGNLEARGTGTILLLVPPALRLVARQILESERIAGELSNTINVHFAGNQMSLKTKAPSNFYEYSGKYDIKLLVCPWISSRAGGSDTAWFLAEEGKHELNFFERKALSVTEETDFETKALKTMGEGRFSTGWSSWKSLWGSQGTNAAYAL